MKPEIGVSVCLATDAIVDLSVVEERTGLPTAFLMTAGQPRISPSGHVWPEPAPRSLWQYRVPNRPTYDLQGVVMEALAALEAVGTEFLALIDEFALDAWLSIHAHMVDETPDGTLAAEVMRRATALRLDLDLDLYVGSPE